MRTWLILSIGCLIILSTGCKQCHKSADSPVVLKSLPAGAQVLFQLDGKALVATFSGVWKSVGNLVPEKEPADIPSWDEVVAGLKQPTGIDLNRIGLVLAALYFDARSGSPPRLAVVVEGLRAKNLVGSRTGEHHGRPLYRLAAEQKLHYAQLDDEHLVAAESPEFLQIVLDTHAGRDPGLENQPLLARLQKIDPAYDQMRVYLLSGDFPGMRQTPVEISGGGFFVDLQDGFSAAIIGDPQGLSRLKTMAERGLTQASNQMAEGMKKAPPEEIKKMGPALEMGQAFIEGLEFELDGDQLRVNYRGDQSPVAMVGALAAVAIPDFIDYTRKARQSGQPAGQIR